MKVLNHSVWPPSRNGYPTCPACHLPVEHDPGPAGVIPIDNGGRYAHRICADLWWADRITDPTPGEPA